MVEIIYLIILLNYTIFVGCDMEPFIVNGEKANIRDVPHSVLVNVMCVGRDSIMIPWICGASILNELVVMTAAQCLAGCDSTSTISIAVGSRERKKALVFSVWRYILHENYRYELFAYDVALLVLKTPLTFGEYVKRVALMAVPPSFETAVVAGWEDIANFLRDEGNLMFFEQFVMKHEKCKAIHYRLPNGTLCGFSRRAESTIGRGDSGSALVVRGYIQIGIVSYKVPSVSRSLVVYTDTGYYYDWITKNARRLYCAN